jgi:hypothetical protein
MLENFFDRIWPLFAATGSILTVIIWVHFARDRLIAAGREPEAHVEATRRDQR